MSKKDKGNELGGIAFVAFFFTGLAGGSLMGRWDAAVLMGLAMGFVAMLLVRMKY